MHRYTESWNSLRSHDNNEVLTGTGPIRNAPQYLYSDDIKQVFMLGHDAPLDWEFDADGLQVDLISRVPSDIACAVQLLFTHIPLRACLSESKT